MDFHWYTIPLLLVKVGSFVALGPVCEEKDSASIVRLALER
jgi:hypothetical protein